MEQAIISGVAADRSEAKVTIEDAPDHPGVVATIFRAVAEEGPGIDMIVQNVGRDGRTDISFLVPKSDLPRLSVVLDRVTKEVGASRYSTDEGVVKVSLVGAGIKSHPTVVADMFEAMGKDGINIEMISTSSIRISCVIREADAERAVRAIHDRFSISEEAAAREEHAV